MRLALPALALGLLLAPAAPAATPPKAGTYEMVMVPLLGPSPIGGPAATDIITCLIKITPKDDGVGGELVSAAPIPPMRGLELKSIALDDDRFKVVLKGPSGDITFEGRVPQAGADTILGTFEVNGRLGAGRVTATEKTALTSASSLVRVTPPEPMRKAQSLSAKIQQFRAVAQQVKDTDVKAKLQQEAAEIETEQGKLYREVVEKHADAPAAMQAAQSLLRMAGPLKLDAAEGGRLTQSVLKVAERYGPRSAREETMRLAELLAPQAALASVAVECAQKADQALTPKDSLEIQTRVLEALAKALKNAGRPADAAQAEARLAKITVEVDREYLANTPPFKPSAFEGRKAPGERAVVLEMFTGAQCPPCVAADVAFDALEKTYKATDLVLIQYHLHIPGPDPMTNPPAEARAEYYGVRSTPSTFFNGKAEAGSGGNLARSEAKYKEYRAVIERLLEQPGETAVTVGATRQGDTITIRADVPKLPAPFEGKRLRLLLVEETIRFVGSNKLRFHHMVVRAMPGGAEGKALTGREAQHTATVKLGDLRQELTKYLDDYAAENRPFPQADRPMEFKHLKVIALVQDETTKEVLQAAVADIGGERAAQ
jgi:hypothetical protein